MLNIDVVENDGVAVASLTGAIDGITAPQAQDKVLPLISNHTCLVLDLAGVTFLSSAGLRMLLLVYRQATSKGVKVALCGLPDQLRDTMSITGFLGFFEVCDDVKSASALVKGCA